MQPLAETSHPSIVKKNPESLRVKPNLLNYAHSAKNTSSSNPIDFFDDGTLNIAYNCIDRHAQSSRATKTALVFEPVSGKTETYTFAELQALTNKFANVLSAYATKGERVFIFLPTIPERYVAFLGALKLGAIVGTMFAAFQESALLDRLQDSEASVVVTNADLYPRIKNIQPKLPHLKTIIIVERGADQLPKAPEIIYYQSEIAKASDKFAIAHMQKDDYAYMLYTSGTTGKPKGVVHAHYDVAQAILTTRDVLDVQDTDVYWCTADLGWVTGVVYGVLGPWGLGATQVIYEGRFSPENWYGVVKKHAVTIWYLAPTAIRMLMGSPADPKTFQLGSLRHLCSVGEPLNPEAIWWALDKFGLPFHDTWWQTELGSISITNYASMDIKPGSMGKPFPGVVAAIVDDTGEPVPAGSEGNLALQSASVPSLMKTIWNNPAKFDSYFQGDWYISGDRGVMDNDGYFWFVGRSDDVINTSGERIGPFEVESALVAHPAVVEAAVIGKPDPLRGEIIKAFVVTRPGVTQTAALKEELKQHVKHHLAGHAYPREIAFIDHLPKTRSGKIMRRILKAQESGLPIGDTSTLENY